MRYIKYLIQKNCIVLFLFLKQELCEDSEWFREAVQQELLGWQCLEPNPWVQVLSLRFCCGLISVSALHC